VHFGNQANDQTATTKPTIGMIQPDLIDYINNHLDVHFDTLHIQVFLPGRRIKQFPKANIPFPA
jgi:hypothetical protein